MKDFDLSKINNVHFIGIGGIGISAIARMMLHEGKVVTGQDIQEGEIVKELRSLGIDVKVGQSYDNIPRDTDLIVYTIAIDTYDSELSKKIKSLKYLEVGLPDIFIKSYPEMLGIISSNKYTIAVCGTHGKTTTTGMIAKILKDNGKDPTVIVGSLLKTKEGKGTNYLEGKSEYFVVEACEYRRSFLNINPKILVITNIDNDHLDYYKDIEDIKSAFREMATKVPFGGYIICNVKDKNIKEVIDGVNAKIIDWGNYFENNLKLKIPGIHNKKNAGAAIAVAEFIGISIEASKNSLSNFAGTWKRFEYKGKLSNGVLLYDDYAHHPTEIKATLQAFRELYAKEDGWKIIVVFQPHLFSRTKLLLSDFAKSFVDSDRVIILPIYHAREFDDGSVSSLILSNEINKNSNNSESYENFGKVEKILFENVLNLDNKTVIVSMGAGDAVKIIDYILEHDK